MQNVTLKRRKMIPQSPGTTTRENLLLNSHTVGTSKYSFRIVKNIFIFDHLTSLLVGCFLIHGLFLWIIFMSGRNDRFFKIFERQSP